MEGREVDQPFKASSRKLNSSFGAFGDQHPLGGDQLKKRRAKGFAAGFSPVENEVRGEDEAGGRKVVKDDAEEENRTGENDIFEKEVDDKTKKRGEEIKEYSYKIRIEYGNYNCKGSGKHKMPISSDRMGDNDYKYGKELEIKSSDDPAEFEEPELYESMRLLKEVEGSKVDFYLFYFFIFV